ncbi:Thiol:disulfide interchange protein DsbC [hydrothermal vent metagenome]|uniref:Thiol:disulfide interchange protein DsbC n=1 Tax=hydrothermal vent metagenome TaxID=652676 RepID=A0A3B0ZPS6_9ZZZZ
MKTMIVAVMALLGPFSNAVLADEGTASGWAEKRAIAETDSAEGRFVTPASKLDDSAVRKTLSRVIPGQTPDLVEESAYKGLFEVVYGSDIFYLSADGRYLFQGDMVDLTTQDNLTEARRTQGRHKLMQTVALDTKIRFIPENGKPLHVVDVFTDVDCFYCQKLHHEMADYLREGIEIRYLAFPRAGVGSHSYEKIISVWCADDQLDEMTLAKNKQQPEKRACENPVQEHMALARKIGVSGTPALVFEDGSLLPGYVPAVQLKKMLDEKKAE